MWVIRGRETDAFHETRRHAGVVHESREERGRDAGRESGRKGVPGTYRRRLGSGLGSRLGSKLDHEGRGRERRRGARADTGQQVVIKMKDVGGSGYAY